MDKVKDEYFNPQYKTPNPLSKSISDIERGKPMYNSGNTLVPEWEDFVCDVSYDKESGGKLVAPQSTTQKATATVNNYCGTKLFPEKEVRK